MRIYGASIRKVWPSIKQPERSRNRWQLLFLPLFTRPAAPRPATSASASPSKPGHPQVEFIKYRHQSLFCPVTLFGDRRLIYVFELRPLSLSCKKRVSIAGKTTRKTLRRGALFLKRGAGGHAKFQKPAGRHVEQACLIVHARIAAPLFLMGESFVTRRGGVCAEIFSESERGFNGINTKGGCSAAVSRPPG